MGRGIYGNLSQREIGVRLGLSRMHVSRLLAKALTDLRRKIDAGR